MLCLDKLPESPDHIQILEPDYVEFDNDVRVTYMYISCTGRCFASQLVSVEQMEDLYIYIYLYVDLDE